MASSAAGVASVVADMPPKKSGRAARPAAANRATRPRSAPPKPTRTTKPRGSTQQTKQTKAAKQTKVTKNVADRRPTRREPAGEVVLGSVPNVSRLVGGLGIVAGLLLAVAVVLPYLAVAEERVVLGGSLASTLVSWIWPLFVVVAGLSVVLGHYPRLGLAALGVAGTVSAAELIGELYWASQPAARGRFEIIAGRRLLTSEVEPLTGWYVGVAGLTVLVAVGIAVGWWWSRVVMDDSESLDPGRPVLGGLAAISGVAAVLALGATLVQIPDQVIITQQPIAGQLRPVETRIPVEGALGLFDRPGLALTSGLLLAGVLVLFSVFATTLRPRLAVVGGLAAFTGYIVALAARALVEAGQSQDIEPTIGGWGLLVVGLAYAGLTVAALLWVPPVRPITRGLPMQPATRRALKSG